MKTKHFAYILLAALMVPALALGQTTTGPFTSGTYTFGYAVPGITGVPGNVAGFFYSIQIADGAEIGSLTAVGLGGTCFGCGTALSGTAWLPSGVALGSGAVSPLFVVSYSLINTNTNNAGADFSITGTPIVHLTNFLGGATGQSVLPLSGTRGQITTVASAPGGVALSPSNFVVNSGSLTGSGVDVLHATGEIPEPATMTMLGGGLAFLFAGVAFRRRRRKEEV